MWSYSPEYDPETKDLAAIPEETKPYLRGEEFVWEGTAHLPGFKEASIAYWQACLTLSRRLVRIFALSLSLPEDYFDHVTTYPGSDGVYNFYPAMTPDAAATSKDVGLGSHTDLQCFTILWQDMSGGLQVLNSRGEWIKVSPIADTFVVNIGDFLMRLSNDRFQSTVHRVYNRATVDRLSMPFFFGFNFNETCSVVPTCTDADNPPKYEPISCGDVGSPSFSFSSSPFLPPSVPSPLSVL
jgi:isopenicillin N synthase-like dioxygenase